jgi:hypothetical protein
VRQSHASPVPAFSREVDTRFSRRERVEARMPSFGSEPKMSGGMKTANLAQEQEKALQWADRRFTGLSVTH